MAPQLATRTLGKEGQPQLSRLAQLRTYTYYGTGYTDERTQPQRSRSITFHIFTSRACAKASASINYRVSELGQNGVLQRRLTRPRGGR